VDWSIFSAKDRAALGAAKNGSVPFFGLVAGVLLALIGIVPALSLTWNERTGLVAEASRIYVFERLPHHLALLTLPREEFARRAAGHIALLAALAVLGVVLRRHAVSRMLQFAAGAVMLACVGLAIEIVLANQPLLAARLLRYYWYRLTDFAAPMGVALAATALISMALAERKAWAPWGFAAAIVLAGWNLTSVAVQRLLHPVPPADARMADYSAWVDVCRWVVRNTPADALFLTPRLNHSFKWRAGRSEVVSRKDIPQDTGGILEWDRRIKDIYYDDAPGGLVGPIDSLGQLGTERVQELATKYGADYVLSDRGQLLALPRAYWNEEYVVYRIEHRTAGDGR
jgi:hypothetical protein